MIKEEYNNVQHCNNNNNNEHPSFHYWENDFKKRTSPLNNSNPYMNNYYNPVQCTFHTSETTNNECNESNDNRPYITLNVKPQSEINPNKEGVSLLLRNAYNERRCNFENLNYVNFSPSDFYYDTPHKEIVFEIENNKNNNNVNKDSYDYLYGNNKHAFEHSSLFYNLKERNKEYNNDNNISMEMSRSGNSSCLQNNEGKYTYNMSYNANPMRYAFKDNKGSLKKKSSKLKK
jgi:hypothetical protein